MVTASVSGWFYKKYPKCVLPHAASSCMLTCTVKGEGSSSWREPRRCIPTLSAAALWCAPFVPCPRPPAAHPALADTEPEEPATRSRVNTQPKVHLETPRHEDVDEEAGLTNYIQQEHSVRQTKIAVVFSAFASVFCLSITRDLTLSKFTGSITPLSTACSSLVCTRQRSKHRFSNASSL